MPLDVHFVEEDENVRQEAKSMAKYAEINFCLLDRRAYNAVEGRGFQQAFQCGIDIGAKFGRLKVANVTVCRTTVSRGASDMATGLRNSTQNFKKP